MSVVDDIKARLDIVDVVSSYVQLQKAGRNFKAACPFHNEKTPSFVVNPERQSWHCFGACATGGDAFSFVMRREGVEFGEALKVLAQRAGVILDQQRDRDKNEMLYQVNQVAAKFYQDALKSSQGKIAGKYLDERGVNDSSIEKFALGYSLNSWDGLKAHLLALGITEDQAVVSGLVYRNEDSHSWDFFRSRLMFPIHDRQGRVAGFGARALDDSTPKYINTAQTPIFNKRNMLYGLHLAAGPIRGQSAAIIVEGYMDVIAAHEHGYDNVVASMGTALTEQQVSQLKSMVSNFVLALDPDTAGQEATLRSLESSWRVIGQQAASVRNSSVGTLYQREQATLKIAALPPGRDPDKLIREDRQEWERLTKEAVPLMDYLIPAVSARFDTSTGQGKAQVVDILRPLIQSAEFFDQDGYLRKLSDTLGVDLETLKASFKTARKNTSRRRSERAESQPEQNVSASLLSVNPKDAVEDFILALLLNRPELKDHVINLAPEYFHKSEDREVFTQWLDCSTIDDLRDALDESLHEYLDYLVRKELAPADVRESEAALRQCKQRLERRHLLELQENLLASEDTSAPPPRELESAITEVNAKIKELSTEKIR